MVEHFPGFKIEIMDGKVRLEYFLPQGSGPRFWSESCLGANLRETRQLAEDAKLEVDVDLQAV